MKILFSIFAALCFAFPVWGQDTSPVFETYEEGLEIGEGPVVVAFWTDWCTTCSRQERVVDELRGSREYDNVRFVKVDWDKHKDSEIGSWYGVHRRSTLISVFDGTRVDILNSETRSGRIEDFLDALVSVSEKEVLLEDAALPAALPELRLDAQGEGCTLGC